MKKLTSEQAISIEKYINAFASSLPAKIAEIDPCIRDLAVFDNFEQGLHNLVSISLKLGGTCATFGFYSLSQSFYRLYRYLQYRPRVSGSTEGFMDVVNVLVVVIKAMASEIKTEHALGTLITRHENFSLGNKAKAAPRLIYLLSSQSDLITSLEYPLSVFGFQVEEIRDTSALFKALKYEGQIVVIIDASFLNHHADLSSNLHELKQASDSRIVYIFVSEHEDFQTRITSVRSGADAFFQIPVDINRLVDRIESFVNLDVIAPIKALLIDSDSQESEFHSFILAESGMEVTCITDPEKSIQTIIETGPDIIIMDYYIGRYKAAELAALIRQQDAFLSIPILFVAGEARADVEVEALLLGGDDVISKPVSAQELVIAVRSKALRSRQIRYFMERDSLTGLLNHTNLKEALAREIMRAQRENTELCFVMIDIDHFKSVNDVYGHLTGDKVLKSLSYLLQERLRQTDIIGRYGGEEFGIILPRTTSSDASLIINKLRGGFSRLKQTGNNTTFSITFSAGIAVFPQLSDAASVAQCADKALYEAKELGRNQVCIYSED